LADLVRLQSDLPINIAGVNPSTGIGTFFTNVDANGNLFVLPTTAGPVVPGTAAINSNLTGGQFNTVLPTLTNTQQSSIQLDSSGRLIIAPTTQGILAEDHNYGVVGANTLRTASEIGNATGAASFNYGAVSAQTLRTASQIGNATGAADFGTGVATAQTLRTVADMYDSTGVGTTSTLINSIERLNVTLSSIGPVAPGTAAFSSDLAGGVYTSAGITLTNGQQASLQLNSTGALIVTGAVTLPYDTNYGTVGANTLRTASQIGNATGAAAFNAGITGAQVLRVVLPTDQTGINTFLDKSGSGTITALNGTVVATTNGCGSVTFNVTGVWIATISLQATVDGINWETTNGSIVALDVTTQFFSTNVFVVVPCGGFSQVRLIATAFTSGTASIAWDAGAGSNVMAVFNNVASAFNAQVVGTITSTPSYAAPAVVVRNIPFETIAYSACATAFVPPATATDIFTITGSATKTIRIDRIIISGTTTSGTAIKVTLSVVKRSTVDTGGTHTAQIAVPYNSTSPAASATVDSYTVNPTALGTSIGVIRAVTTSVSAAGLAQIIEWDFDAERPLFLIGTTQQLAINLNSTSVTGPVFSISVEWSEV
jgi:hypothetical protein